MSGYLRNIISKQTFDGDEVVLTMTPVLLEEVLAVRGADSTDMAKVVIPMMARHLQSVTGLTAADGTAVTKEEVLANAYFVNLIVNGGMELIKHASPQNPSLPAP